MLTNWQTLLDYLGQAAWQQQDAQSAFEIAQLQGLANSVIAGSDPGSDDNLKNLVTNAVRRMVRDGWASTEGYGVGVGYDYWVRGLSFAGVDAWFGIHFGEARRSNRPLWLACRHFGKTTDAQMRCRLAALALDELIEWETRFDRNSTPIPIPPGADNDAALESIVARLTQIARLIDPAGPTYKDHPLPQEQPR